MQRIHVTYTPEEVEAARQESLLALFNETFKSKDEVGDQIEGLDPNDYQPGTMGCHEALHAASMVLSMADMHLLEHPAVVLDEEAYKLAFEAHTALFNLYQHLGVSHLLADEDGEG